MMKCFLNYSNTHSPHSAVTCLFFTWPWNYYGPLNIFSSSCGELLWNSCGIRSDLLGVVMTFGSSLMQSSSSMWTRVALRVTTPFPLHTLLGSKSENIQNKSLTSAAPHRSRHSKSYIRYSQSALLLQSCWEFKLLLPHAPNGQNRTVTSKPGHQINSLLSRKTNCHDYAVRAGSRAAGARPVCFFSTQVTSEF